MDSYGATEAMAGVNTLAITVTPSTGADYNESCGIYARGQVSRFRVAQTSDLLARSAITATMDLEHLGLTSGSVVRVRQWATNQVCPHLLSLSCPTPVPLLSHSCPTPVYLRFWPAFLLVAQAGLATPIESEQLMMLDDTPPSHAAVYLCTPGGRLSSDGRYFSQRSEEMITVCWQEAGFADHESGTVHAVMRPPLVAICV